LSGKKPKNARTGQEDEGQDERPSPITDPAEEEEWDRGDEFAQGIKQGAQPTYQESDETAEKKGIEEGTEKALIHRRQLLFRQR